MQQVSYQNKTISFEVEGSGFPLVLVHGFCEDSSIWQEVMPELEDIRLIRIDLPGFGKSEPVETASIEYYADAVKAVLDHLKIKDCLLVGHSMGGYTALAFAERHGDYLSGLGILHAHPFEDSDAGKENRQKSIDFILKNGSIYFVKQLIPKFFPPGFISSKRYLVDRLVFKASQYAPAGILGGLTAMKNRPDRTEVLRSISVPVLFFLGEKDDLIPFEKQLEQVSLPAVSLVHLQKRIGHMGMLENPKKCGAALREFYAFCLDYQGIN